MAEDAKLVKAVVATGRTVVIGKKSHGPGAEISLPAEEVAELRASGFLVDPDAPVVPRDNGPTFGVKEGPSIKVAA